VFELPHTYRPCLSHGFCHRHIVFPQPLFESWLAKKISWKPPDILYTEWVAGVSVSHRHSRIVSHMLRLRESRCILEASGHIILRSLICFSTLALCHHCVKLEWELFPVARRTSVLYCGIGTWQFPICTCILKTF
jgi:hypothetical protein